MLYERFQDTPRFVSLNYLKEYSQPCEKTSDPEEYFEEEYAGTGIPPEEHPMKRFTFRPCKNCGNKDVLIIYAHWCVSSHSGDAYWDYEAFCDKCGKYTQCSYNEND